MSGANTPHQRTSELKHGISDQSYTLNQITIRFESEHLGTSLQLLRSNNRTLYMPADRLTM